MKYIYKINCKYTEKARNDKIYFVNSLVVA